MFAGPTLASLDDPTAAERAGFVVRPPARRGDIAALLDGAPGTLAVVDGAFNQSLAVGHAELRAAIGAGWQVWGLSSMGAIRAFEMRSFGMIGFGKVYGHFLARGDFQDDEVALLHLPGPSYRSVTEPLVHMRFLVQSLEQHSLLSARAARQIISKLKSVWYGERTRDLLTTLLEEYGGQLARDGARGWVGEIHRYRVKSQDLEVFLRESMWLKPPPRVAPMAAPYCEA